MVKYKLKNTLLGIVSLMMLCSCYDYTNWKKVEIPTDTPVRATVKIPNEWEFRNENGWVSIYDKENEDIVAQQFTKYSWEYDRTYNKDPNHKAGEFKVTSWDEFELNPNLMYTVPESNIFIHVYGSSNSMSILTNKSNSDIYFVWLYIYYKEDAKDEFLQLMFNKNVEYEIIKQFGESSYFGGRIE